MADPTVIDCAGACTVTVVHELAIPVLNLSPAEAGNIGLAILGVWAVAFAFRTLIRTLNIDEKGESDDSRE